MRYTQTSLYTSGTKLYSTIDLTNYTAAGTTGEISSVQVDYSNVNLITNVLSNPQTEIVPSSLTDFQTGIGGSASVAWSTTVGAGGTGGALHFRNKVSNVCITI